MKILNSLRFTFILILCATLTNCDDDDPVVCNTIAVHDGNNQGGVIGQALPKDLQVKVTNTDGQPLPNTTVLWEVVEGGGSLSASNSKTNAEGIASSSWTYGQSNGRVRASLENSSQCKTSSTEFRAEPISLTLNSSTTHIDPIGVKSQENCFEFNYVIGVTTNTDLSHYFIDIEGEYKYETRPSSEFYYATGTVSADGKSVTFMDCYIFKDETYIDDWFTISLYNYSDIEDGEPRENAKPVITSNRIGPFRTNRPPNSPRLANGSDRPVVSARLGRR